MLLTDARRRGAQPPDGSLVPLAEQDREPLEPRSTSPRASRSSPTRWRRTELGPYQLQAAIAALHDEAPNAADTDWPQILALYELLERIAPNPMVTLNRAVAVAMARRARGRPRPAGHARRRRSPTITACTRSARTCSS